MSIKTVFTEDLGWKTKKAFWNNREWKWDYCNGKQVKGKRKVNTRFKALKGRIRDDLFNSIERS